jgi:hypothetical protein
MNRKIQFHFEIKMPITQEHREYFLIIVGLILIVIHGLIPSLFVVDGITILILFIIAIPILANFLKKAKLFGAEFEFKDAITATEKLVELSIKNAIESKKTDKSPYKPQFAVFDLSSVKELIGSDRVLALAALRIEIEKKLRLAANQYGIPPRDNKTTIKLLQFLMQKGVFPTEQIEAIRHIQRMCNEAIHGFEVSQAEAEKIVELADKLNESFSIGYSINFSPNPDYKKQGFVCPWEHCIEHFPVTEKENGKSCPAFGHDCPGGANQVIRCKTAGEFSE